MSGSHKTTRIISGAIGAVFALLIVTGVVNGLRPLPTVKASIATLPSVRGTASVAWPTVGEAAVGAVNYGLLAQSPNQHPLPTASVTKVMVSLAVLDKLPLKPGEAGPLFTVTQADVDRYTDYVARDGSVIPVVVGEQLSEYQALQALMLPSANNIADSLAVWVFGSLGQYHAYAANLAQQLGMTHTTFAGDASGLSPLTTSTPEDLVKLGLAAMDKPVLKEIVAQRTAILPVAGQVFNYNGLLGRNGIVGIKTGNSDEAGGCYLFAANYTINGKDVTIVGAVMGAVDLTGALNSGPPLLDSAHSNFSVQTPVKRGQVLATYHLPWGKTASAVAKQDISLLLWNGTPLSSTAEAHTIQGKQTQDAKVGIVHVTAGNQKLDSDIVLQSAVDAPGWWWRATRH